LYIDGDKVAETSSSKEGFILDRGEPKEIDYQFRVTPRSVLSQPVKFLCFYKNSDNPRPIDIAVVSYVRSLSDVEYSGPPKTLTASDKAKRAWTQTPKRDRSPKFSIVEIRAVSTPAKPSDTVSSQPQAPLGEGSRASRGK
jgi:hypothetical protein